MIENIKDVFRTANSCIKHDNLLDAYMLLFSGGLILFLFLVIIGLIITAIVNYPGILLFLLIPILPYMYILWMKRRIKNKEENVE